MWRKPQSLAAINGEDTSVKEQGNTLGLRQEGHIGKVFFRPRKGTVIADRRKPWENERTCTGRKAWRQPPAERRTA